MLKDLLKNTIFLSEIKKFFKENEKEIIDILLFGSVMRGKENPNDIDILIIYKSEDNLELNYKLKKRLERTNLNMQINSKKYSDLFKSGFKARESFLSEGYSLVNQTPILQGLGYSSLLLFKYELKGLNKSDRMRFYYALYGRNASEGILKKLNAKKFSDGTIICAISNSEKIKEFFDIWKIGYIEVPVLLPIRILNVI